MGDRPSPAPVFAGFLLSLFMAWTPGSVNVVMLSVWSGIPEEKQKQGFIDDNDVIENDNVNIFQKKS
jgi:hypothetical protein